MSKSLTSLFLVYYRGVRGGDSVGWEYTQCLVIMLYGSMVAGIYFFPKNDFV